MFEFSKEKTRHSFKNSLDNLGLDYIDVIQVDIYLIIVISKSYIIFKNKTFQYHTGS